MEITIVNVYGPNIDTPNFYSHLGGLIEKSEQDYVLICGDLNMVFEPDKDSHNYVNINNTRSREKFLDLLLIILLNKLDCGITLYCQIHFPIMLKNVIFFQATELIIIL